MAKTEKSFPRNFTGMNRDLFFFNRSTQFVLHGFLTVIKLAFISEMDYSDKKRKYKGKKMKMH